MYETEQRQPEEFLDFPKGVSKEKWWKFHDQYDTISLVHLYCTQKNPWSTAVYIKLDLEGSRIKGWCEKQVKEMRVYESQRYCYIIDITFACIAWHAKLQYEIQRRFFFKRNVRNSNGFLSRRWVRYTPWCPGGWKRQDRHPGCHPSALLGALGLLLGVKLWKKHVTPIFWIEGESSLMLRCIVIFRDFPYNRALFGLAIWMTPAFFGQKALLFLRVDFVFTWRKAFRI